MFDPHFIDEVTIDYWYDEGFRQSQEALANFTESEWKNLFQSWKMQSEEWQERLAYILGDGNSIQHTELLFYMLREGEKNISLSATESLRSISLEAGKQACISHAKNLAISTSEIEECDSINKLIELVLCAKVQP